MALAFLWLAAFCDLYSCCLHQRGQPRFWSAFVQSMHSPPPPSFVTSPPVVVKQLAFAEKFQFAKQFNSRTIQFHLESVHSDLSKLSWIHCTGHVIMFEFHITIHSEHLVLGYHETLHLATVREPY